METKEVKISVPEGYEIDKEKSSFEKIVFKEVKKELPKSFSDLKIIDGFYVDDYSNIEPCSPVYENAGTYNGNVFPTKEEAEACLALSQLCQLRDAYNGEPLAKWCDWANTHQTKSVIYYSANTIATSYNHETKRTLAFKTAELRDEFLNNFKVLIEIAKPLL